MSHALKFTVAILIALSTHGVSGLLFEGVRYLATGDYSELQLGPPWYLVFQVLLVAAILAGCMILKSKTHPRLLLAWLVIPGLLAVQYLALALAHWHTSTIEIATAATAVVCLFVVYFKFRLTVPDVWDRQRVDPNRLLSPDPRPGLILFLSFLTGERFRGAVTTHTADPLSKAGDPPTQAWRNYQEDIRAVVNDIQSSAKYDIRNEDLLEPFKVLNIRMPLEAIRFQLALSELTDVVLIPSIDTPRRDYNTGKELPEVAYSGSHGQADFFAQIVELLFQPLISIAPRVAVVRGADFEDERQISRAITDARKILITRKAGLHHIDVTGGQAICSVVGAVKCLGENDRFTYVSTRDYKSRCYDFVVESPPEVG